MGYFSASLFLFAVIVFLIVGIKEARRAKLLRNEICKLELSKSTFADVSRIFPKYEGYVPTHDNMQHHALQTVATMSCTLRTQFRR